MVLTLVLASDRDVEMEADDLQELLSRAQRHSAFRASHAACIVQSVPSLTYAALESLAEGLRGAEGIDCLRIVCELIVRSENESAETLVRHLDSAVMHLSPMRDQIVREVQEASVYQSSVRPGLCVQLFWRILDVAWKRGQAFGRENNWADCGAVLARAGKVLEILEPLEDVVETRAWLLAMKASTLVQEMKVQDSMVEVCDLALQSIELAHQLCRRGAPRVFDVLVLLEFEVRCLAGASESQLKRYVDDASAQEVISVRCLLAMAKVASGTHRRLAIHCLQKFLSLFLAGHNVVDVSPCATAYREMIGLYSSRNETLGVYDGILHLLGGFAAAPATFPEDEIAWLVSTAWNNGAHFYRMQQYKWSERWMGKSISIAKFCPGRFSEEVMSEAYVECLKRCGGCADQVPKLGE